MNSIQCHGWNIKEPYKIWNKISFRNTSSQCLKYKKYIHTPCFMVCITPHHIGYSMIYTRTFIQIYSQQIWPFLSNNIEKGLPSIQDVQSMLTYIWKWFSIKCPQDQTIWKTSLPYSKFNSIKGEFWSK